MELDKFVEKILERVMSLNSIKKVKQCIEEEMSLSGFNYDTTKVECQVFDKDNNYDPRVEVSSEGYSDGEIIFIDYHLD